MVGDGPPPAESTESAQAASLLRHRLVPNRVVGDTLIVARPRDGAPVTMTSAAVLVWRQLDDWTTSAEIDVRLADAFPEVPAEKRASARSEILRILRNDDLLERH
jgi:hypothetical protein